MCWFLTKVLESSLDFFFPVVQLSITFYSARLRSASAKKIDAATAASPLIVNAETVTDDSKVVREWGRNMFGSKTK